MQKRIQYLDIIKVISIFLVVFLPLCPACGNHTGQHFYGSLLVRSPHVFHGKRSPAFTRPLNLSKHIRKTLLIYIVLVLWKLDLPFSIGALCRVPVADFGKNQSSLYLFAFGSLEGIGTGHLWFIEALFSRIHTISPVPNRL